MMIMPACRLSLRTGWWSHDEQIHQDGKLPLADSSFTAVIRKWVQNQRDRPPLGLSTGREPRTSAAGTVTEATGWSTPSEAGPQRSTLQHREANTTRVLPPGESRVLRTFFDRLRHD
jgi:hypothetical protein